MNGPIALCGPFYIIKAVNDSIFQTSFLPNSTLSYSFFLLVIIVMLEMRKLNTRISINGIPTFKLHIKKLGRFVNIFFLIFVQPEVNVTNMSSAAFAPKTLATFLVHSSWQLYNSCAVKFRDKCL